MIRRCLLALVVVFGLAPSAQAQITIVPSRNVIVTQGTQTADTSAISTSATWNNAGVTFTHWKAVITDTASASGSLPINILGGAAGSTTLLSLGKQGNLTTGGAVIAGTGIYPTGTSRGFIDALSDGVFRLSNAASTDFSRLQFGGTTSSFPALKRSLAVLEARLADDSGYASVNASVFNAAAGHQLGGVYLTRSTAPTIASGFGTSPSIVASNGTAAFTVNVGTGGAASTGVITMPAATTGWHIRCDNTSANTATVFVTKQTAFTTTSVTIGNYDAAGAAANWTSGNLLVCSALAF